MNLLPLYRSITAMTKISTCVVKITTRNRNVTQMPDNVHQGRPKFEIKIARHIDAMPARLTGCCKREA